jgi:hypothetical protein
MLFRPAGGLRTRKRSRLRLRPKRFARGMPRLRSAERLAVATALILETTERTLRRERLWRFAVPSLTLSLVPYYSIALGVMVVVRSMMVGNPGLRKHDPFIRLESQNLARIPNFDGPSIDRLERIGPSPIAKQNRRDNATRRGEKDTSRILGQMACLKPASATSE